MRSHISVKTIAVIGTGIMGRGMAESLHRAGHSLRLYARNPARIADLRKDRVEICASIEEAARGADLAVMCLTEDDVVRQAFFEGVLPAEPGIIIDTGTTSPLLTSLMHGAASAGGIAFLDAPMTGSKQAAAAGQILYMVGGSSEDMDRARFFFEACGKHAVHCGKSGAGQRTKIALNLIQAGLLQVYIEGMMLAGKDGVDSATLLEVLQNSAAASPLLDFKMGCIRKRDFSTHFSLKNMNKDMNHAMERAKAVHAALPVSQLLKSIYEAGMAAGQGDADFCSLALVNEALNHHEIR